MQIFTNAAPHLLTTVPESSIATAFAMSAFRPFLVLLMLAAAE